MALSIGSVPLDAEPENIGKGWWGMLHAIAYVHDSSTIPRSREMFIENVVRGIGEHFPCMHCRSHAVEHMTRVDPIRNILKQPAGGCLAWSYRFHEAVNERLKKPSELRPTLPDLEKFLSEMREGKGCQNCGGVAPTITRFLHRELTD